MNPANADAAAGIGGHAAKADRALVVPHGGIIAKAADRGVRVGGRKVLPAAMTGAMIVAVADRAKILNAATRLRCRNSTARWCRMRKAWIP